MAKIFVIEDDVALAQIYKRKLEDGKHEVEVVSDKEAVAKVSQKKPDLVLLDILMPISGLDILREIKSAPETAQIPILLLTNVADELTIEKGLKYGADGYLLKSEMTPDQILSRVNMTLETTVAPTP